MRTELETTLWHAWRMDKNSGLAWYVADVPEKPADWEYTQNIEDARPINSYWFRRFVADMVHCNDKGYGRPIITLK